MGESHFEPTFLSPGDKIECKSTKTDANNQIFHGKTAENE